jgi:hypothetical protein
MIAFEEESHTAVGRPASGRDLSCAKATPGEWKPPGESGKYATRMRRREQQHTAVVWPQRDAPSGASADQRLGTARIEELTMHTPGMAKRLAMVIVALGFTAWADEAADPAEALAAESIAYCQETARDADKLTPQLIMEKVNEAAQLIEAKGRHAFPAFKGKDSPFLFLRHVHVDQRHRWHDADASDQTHAGGQSAAWTS